VSALGETVAALAAHIADADPHAARSNGYFRAASRTWASDPENPSCLSAQIGKKFHFRKTFKRRPSGIGWLIRVRH
jgi:hypothetical protein